MNITIEIARNKLAEVGMYDFLEWIEGCYPTHPEENFKRPVLTSKYPNEGEILQYQKDLREYDSLQDVYLREMMVYKDQVRELDEIRISLIREYSGLFTIPLQYQEKVWQYVWDLISLIMLNYIKVYIN